MATSKSKGWKLALAGALCVLTQWSVTDALADHGGGVRITRAEWDADDQRLRLRGDGDRGTRVTVSNAFDPAQILGSDSPDGDHRWEIRVEDPFPVPCRVSASQNGNTDEMDVADAPAESERNE